jgi:glycerol transport system ATP-binding protein
VREILTIIDLRASPDRRAQGLTADQKQKIALGRGLVRSDVSAILFDEPLTVIDPQMKWELRSQLKQLHKRFAYTMIYVTHDQTEALTFADRVVVMYEGEIVQVGTPEQLFERPEHTFVGYFIGSPGMNVIPAEIDGAQARVAGHVITLPGRPQATGPGLQLGIRPEFVRLGREGLPVTVRRVEDLGRHKVVWAALGGQEIAAILGEDEALPADLHCSFAPEGINVYAQSRRVPMEA